MTVGALLLLTVPLAPVAIAQDDGYDLLPEGEGRDETFGMCSGCHSIKLVVQQGLSRERWDELLDYMVEEQGMPELDDETRRIVLDYLGEHLNTDHRPDYIKR
ncbi:MAG: aldehyde dehydrogenase [Alphaproteobacteria bacterium]